MLEFAGISDMLKLCVIIVVKSKVRAKWAARLMTVMVTFVHAIVLLFIKKL